MALPGSGTLALSDIQTEFGGSNPISLSEYYGVDTPVPGSGTISISDFYGTSAYTPPATYTPPYFDSVKAFGNLSNGSQVLDFTSMSLTSGKILLVYLCARTVTSWTTPAGWTALFTAANSGGTPGHALFGIATGAGTPTSATFTVGGAGSAIKAVAISLQANYVGNAVANGTGGNPDAPAYTHSNSTSAALVFGCLNQDDGNNASVAPTGFNNITDFGGTVGAASTHIMVGERYRPGIVTLNPTAWSGLTNGAWRAAHVYVTGTA